LIEVLMTGDECWKGMAERWDQEKFRGGHTRDV